MIDVESQQYGHYTTLDQQWLRFLAQEAVEVIEAVELASRRWFLDRLAQFDRDMDQMRHSTDVKAIQDARTPMLEQLIKETCKITGADKAQIYVALNAYEDSGFLKLDVDQKPIGALGAVVSWPDKDIKDNKFKQNIHITLGMAGHVVMTHEPDFFNDHMINLITMSITSWKMRDPALVQPVMEGGVPIANHQS